MVIISSEALDKIKARIASHKVWGIRLLLLPAGCNGWKWELKYEDNPSENGDEIFYGMLAVDPQTLSIVDRIEIDYKEKGLQEEFVIRTPAATAECGCGESFTV